VIGASAGAVAFDLGSAHVRFRSAKTDWFVVSGSRAVLQGSGTVNGKSGYSFRITATDGPDTFRIKILRTSDGWGATTAVPQRWSAASSRAEFGTGRAAVSG
jgi:hypothetical protein